MGNVLDNLSKFFEFPIKRYPICFHRPEDFTSTGEEVLDKEPTSNQKTIDMVFEKILLETQRRNKAAGKTYLQKKFPKWSKESLLYLQNLFMIFYDSETALLKYADLSRLLDSFGNDTLEEIRFSKFKDVDRNNDGRINFEEFLTCIYNLDSNGDIFSICDSITMQGEKISFINGLSLEKQLQNGFY